jgi:peptidyl-prolyl cis-trans isomerase SurA
MSRVTKTRCSFKVWAGLALCLSLSFQDGRIAQAADTVDRILVIVNDEIVTESDLTQALYPIVTRLRATTAGPDLDAKIQDARKLVLSEMIKNQLIISAARAMDPKYKMAAEPAEIDKMIVDMRAKFPSDEVFDQVMKEQGISHKDLRDRFRDDIMKRNMVDFKVRSRVTLSPGENRRYYDEHPKEFAGVAEVHARQILVRVGTARTDELALSTVNSIVEQLAKGAAFADLAKEYSEASDAAEGGDMGWVRKGQFMERIDRAIFKLKTGQTSAPIKSQLGYHLFRVDEKRVSAPVSYESALNKIDNYLYKKKMAQELGAWLKELRRDAFISYQDPEIAKMMAEPVPAPAAA